MDKNIKYLWTVNLIYCCLLYCQGQSFSIDFDDKSTISEYYISPDNSLYYTTVTAQNSILIHKIDSIGNTLWTNEFKEIREGNNSLFEKNKSNKHIITTSKDICFAKNYIENDTTKFLVARFSPFGELIWVKGFKYFDARTISNPTIFGLDNQKIRVVSSFNNTIGSNLIGLLDLNEDGSIFESRTYRDECLPQSKIHETKLSNSNIALIKNLDNEPKSIVSIYSSSLSLIGGISVEANITDIVFNNGKYYVLGNTSEYSINSFSTNDGVSFPIVSCFDTELNLLWSRKIDVPIIWFSTSLDVLKENMVIKLKGANEYKNIEFLFTINSNGEIVDSNRITSDDFFFTFQSIGRIGHNVAMIVQADTIVSARQNLVRLGEDFGVLGCYMDNYCLNIVDVNVEVMEEKNHSLRVLFVRLDTFNFQNEIEFSGFEKKIDSCIDNFPAFPVPIFSHPDTICVNDPLVFEKLQNTGADSVQWSIAGSSIEQPNQLNPSGVVYLEEGNYKIAQTVYQNGCANSYESSITVLKSISNFADDTIALCKDSTILLDVETEDANSYLWNDGSTSPEKLISTPGIHTVEINNESCSQKINFNVEAFDYSLIENDLERDTATCSEAPLLLQPTLHENAAFIWSDGEESLERYIVETGYYELITSLNGCSTSSEIFVEVDSCLNKIYIPNSFSPNDDGVNDVFQPLGDDFEIVEFKVFDRWGTLVHDDNMPWAGSRLDRDKCPVGVYVYVLNVINSRLNVDNLFKGSVTLLR